MIQTLLKLDRKEGKNPGISTLLRMRAALRVIISTTALLN